MVFLGAYFRNIEQNDSRKTYPAKTPAKQNPKSEYRNPKQTQRQINLKSGKSKTVNPKEACLEFYQFWSFGIVSNFGPRGLFRASNLLFLAPLRESRFFRCRFHRTKISNIFG